MKKIALAMSLFAALAGGASTADAQVRAPNYIRYTVEGYACEVSVNADNDIATVRLTTGSYCGGSSAGTVELRRQYGRNVEGTMPTISYDLYVQLVTQLINSSWRKVTIDVVGTAASKITFKSN